MDSTNINQFNLDAEDANDDNDVNKTMVKYRSHVHQQQGEQEQEQEDDHEHKGENNDNDSFTLENIKHAFMNSKSKYSHNQSQYQSPSQSPYYAHTPPSIRSFMNSETSDSDASDTASIRHRMAGLYTSRERGRGGGAKGSRKRHVGQLYSTAALNQAVSSTQSTKQPKFQINTTNDNDNDNQEETGLPNAGDSASHIDNIEVQQWVYTTPNYVNPVWTNADYDAIEYCFCCDHSQNRMEMIDNPRLTKMKNIVDDNFGITCAAKWVELVRIYYNKEIKNYTKDKKEWPDGAIYRHYTQHDVSIIVMMEDALRVHNSAMNVLANNGLFKIDKVSKRQDLDPKNARLYLTFYHSRKSLINDIMSKRSGNLA
jgi:hypothetical protein